MIATNNKLNHQTSELNRYDSTPQMPNKIDLDYINVIGLGLLKEVLTFGQYLKTVYFVTMCFYNVFIFSEFVF